MEELVSFFKEANEKFIAVADEVLKSMSFTSTPFQTSEQVKEETRSALMEIITAKDIRVRMQRGFSVLSRELLAYETPVIMSEVKKEWDKYSAFIMNQDKIDFDKNSLSEEVLAHFYKCGLRLFENKIYQEAADVFFVINSIDKGRHNAWMALGLSEKNLNNYEEALTAFSMAVLTNKESVFAFVHLAECYIALGEKTDAEECIKAGLDLVKNKNDEESVHMALYLLSLKI